MSELNISRRSVAKGLAWSAPAVSLIAAAPASAATVTPVCPSITLTSCWNCGYANYIFLVTPYAGGASINTSARVVTTSTTTPFTIRYTISHDSSVTTSNAGLNGEWSNAGTWTQPTLNEALSTSTKSVYDILVSPNGDSGDMCGGITLKLPGLSTAPASISLTAYQGATAYLTDKLPAGCDAPSAGFTFVRDVSTNETAYGATGKVDCRGSAVWI